MPERAWRSPSRCRCTCSRRAGLVNKTPEEFSEAIEEGTDVPPAVLQETVDLFNTKQVKLLVYNEQTTGPQTEKVLAAAKANSIRVVPVTETLPDGKDYLSWMRRNLRAIQRAGPMTSRPPLTGRRPRHAQAPPVLSAARAA